MKKAFLAMVMTLFIAAPAFLAAGCNRGNIVEKVDHARTQLYCVSYNGGFGSDWLDLAKARFEKENAEVCFEPGVTYKGVEKKGVQIMVSRDKTNGGEKQLSLAGVSKSEVYFCEQIYLSHWLGAEVLMDITDIVEENLKEKYGEDASIESKFTEQQKQSLKVGGKYYAIPHNEGYMGIHYNVDLFEEYALYFSNAEDEVFVFDGKDVSERRTGPSGIPGGYDAGLPITYSDFFLLCDEMASKNIIPLYWTGGHTQYNDGLMTCLAGNIEGAEQAALAFNFSGTGKNIISVGADIPARGQVKPSNITHRPGVAVNNPGGYEVFRQAGRYYALEFYEKIFSDTKYYDAKNCFSAGISHIGAQENFLYAGRSGKQQIGMLVEGTWWENEAKGIFQSMEKTYGASASRANRRFGFMPLPKPDADMVPAGVTVSSGVTLLDSIKSYAFINAHSTTSENKIKLAKKFLQFCYTYESLAEYTVEVGLPRALQYDLKEADFERIPHYGKTVWQARKNAEIVYPFSSNSVFLSSESNLSPNPGGPPGLWTTAMSNSPVLALHNGTTAEQYFRNMESHYNSSMWANSYN